MCSIRSWYVVIANWGVDACAAAKATAADCVVSTLIFCSEFQLYKGKVYTHHKALETLNLLSSCEHMPPTVLLVSLSTDTTTPHMANTSLCKFNLTFVLIGLLAPSLFSDLRSWSTFSSPFYMSACASISYRAPTNCMDMIDRCLLIIITTTL